MSLTDLTQDERLDLRYFKRIFLVEIDMGTETLYFSDRNFLYDYGTGTQRYEAFLSNIEGLGLRIPEDITNIYSNMRVKLTFVNKPFRTYDYLIEYFEANRLERREISIYELRLIDWEETFSSDVKVLLAKVIADQPQNITRSSFQVVCSDIIHSLDNALPLEPLTTSDYSGIDKDEVGKYANILYGECEKIRCHAVDAGAASSLVGDITSSQTTIEVSSTSEQPSFPSSGTICIDEEEITYTGISGNSFTGCTRGANSTTATTHKKGAAVWEKKSSYVYLIANHPVKSIGDVFVDDVRVASGVTKYTGQSGDELTGYEGKAVIVLSSKFTLVRKVDLDTDVNDTIGHNDSLTVSDDISVTSTNTTKNIYPTGHSTYGDVTDADYAYDDSDETAAQLNYYYGGSYIILNFSSTSYGTIVSQTVVAKFSGRLQILVEGGSWSSEYVYSGTHTVRYEGKSGGSWDDYVQVGKYMSTQTSPYVASVYDVYKEVEYTPTLNKSGSAYRSGGITKTGTVTVSLTGNSAADVVVGGSVYVDVDGYQDDASGTYTGTADALIERPDHVFKHILIALMGRTSSEIGSTFSNSGTEYSSAITDGYKFAFNLSNVATTLSRLISELAWQCRSRFYEWKGKFELVFQADSMSSSSLTLDEDMILEEPIFGKTHASKIYNKLQGKYDFQKEEFKGCLTKSDSGSESTYGTLIREYRFTAVKKSTMVDDVLGWILAFVKEAKKTVDLTTYWKIKSLDPLDVFEMSWIFFDSTDFQLLEIMEKKGRILIKGISW